MTIPWAEAEEARTNRTTKDVRSIMRSFPPFLGARAAQDVFEAQVPLVARILEDLLAVVARQRHHERPRPHPGVGIVEGHFPAQRLRADRREALHQVELLAVVAV